MKKFEFSLAVVQRYKQTLEKKQKADLAKVMARIHAMQADQVRVEQGIAACAKSQEKSLRQSHNLVYELQWHHAHLILLRDRRKDLIKRIAQAEEEKRAIQQQLIVLMKELKALERLREEEYGRYLEEVRLEEEKVLGDLMSHTASSEEKDEE